MEIIDISILGKNYSLSCPKEEKDNLINASVYVNNLMLKIKETNKNQTNERIAIIVALQLANNLLNIKLCEHNNKDSEYSILSIQKLLDLINKKLDGI